MIIFLDKIYALDYALRQSLSVILIFTRVAYINSRYKAQCAQINSGDIKSTKPKSLSIRVSYSGRG